MERILLKNLLEWKNNPKRKPLVLNGARQVGKTWLLKEFGKRYYENCIYISMDLAAPEIKQFFDEYTNVPSLLKYLELFFHTKIKLQKTLLIFDEIQEIPQVLTFLKYFHENAPEYHVAVSGNLLGLFLHRGMSFPVGKVDFLILEPLNFEEFLIANGEKKLVRTIKEKNEPILDSVLKEYLNYYLLVGGMPEVVVNWIETKNIEMVDKIQNAILLAYLNDFSRRADSITSTRIRQVWDSLPRHFTKESGKFIYGLIKNGARAREYELAIQWLVDSGIVRKVNRVERGDRLPLNAYKDPNSYKLYFVDIGLFRKLAGISSTMIMKHNAIFSEFNGLIAEQFVLQQINRHDVFYWNSKATSEIDFVLQIADCIVPIEVKSGENVKAKSLKVYRELYNPKISIRFSLKKPEFNNGLLSIPLYVAFIWLSLFSSR
jgi:predicted AAA+ superfamily ATPase